LTEQKAWPWPKSDMTITNTVESNVVQLETSSHTLDLEFAKAIDLHTNTTPNWDDVFTTYIIPTSTDTILPCPFCGSDHISHITVPSYETPDLPAYSWVQCMSCGVEVNSKKTLPNNVTPLQAWNRRK
jgi:predicted RNA-binding Zn-ribbon protein involved in translation (DUF1610 family)